MKKYLIFGLLVAVVLSVSVVLAARPDSTEKANPSGRTVSMPAHAVEIAPGIFYLGTAMDNGRVVQGYAMFVKPGTECGNGICEPGENARKCPADCAGGDEEPDTSSCYDFLARGAKWKSIEPYIVDSINTRGLDEEFVASNVAMDIDKWEAAAGVNILGDEIAGTVDGADLDSPDNKNEVYFADIDYEGAIAVTIIWGVFGGPPPFRELVEWDQIYDDVDFDWSATGEAGKMDFENIATHELGHSVGLADLYGDECSEQTMYGYANYGETKKRTLKAGDITGVQKLYGSK
ncbi:MAG: matrixin family metalloprotease [Candidatus Portnoybacteria bacterium]|nr:matrixin family metalloprotease [Candidatus Portnoybacteria bacterium]